MGYHRAGFDVVGVDLVRQPDYPFTFVLGDALTYPLDGFDVVHASPPCKRWAATATFHASRPRLFNPHPDCLTPTVFRLGDLDVPWVIENVPGAPLPWSVQLCGSSFGLGVRRHRLFMSNVDLDPPPCRHKEQGQVISVVGHNPPGRGKGIKGPTPAECQDAMGIDWLRRGQLSQAIPPAYTEWLGAQVLAHLGK